MRDFKKGDVALINSALNSPIEMKFNHYRKGVFTFNGHNNLCSIVADWESTAMGEYSVSVDFPVIVKSFEDITAYFHYAEIEIYKPKNWIVWQA